MTQFFVCRLAQATARGATLLALLSGCAATAGHEVRYTGALSGCGAEHAATLTRLPGRAEGGGSFAFAPGDGALIIRGAVAPDGGLIGNLNTQPPAKPPFMLTVRGRVGPDTADVVYATPNCRAHGQMHRVGMAPLP